jgi:hypothetical protein
MKTLYSSVESAYSLLEIPYLDWLGIQESPLFLFIPDQYDSHWHYLQQSPSLNPYSGLVSLVKVGEALFKFDGNIRKELWQSGKLQPPETLMAQVFEVTEAEFSALNAEAHNKRIQSLPEHELIKEIYRELGMNFTSDRIKCGFISETINLALRGRPRPFQDKRLSQEREDIDLKKAIKLFSDELTLIDSLNPKPDIFFTGVLAGALIMLGTHRDLTEFFTRVNNRQGEHKDGLEDPVAGLVRNIDRHRMDDRGTSSYLSIDLCKKTIQAVTLWEEGAGSPLYWRRKLVSGFDHMPYIREMKRAKHIDGERDL